MQRLGIGIDIDGILAKRDPVCIGRYVDEPHIPRNFRYEIDTVDGSVQGINDLSKECRLEVVSFRDDAWRYPTEEWLSRCYGKSFSKVNLIDIYGKQTKSGECKYNNLAAHFDDDPEVARDCSMNGIESFLMNYGEYTVFERDNLHLVNNWKEFVDGIRSLY